MEKSASEKIALVHEDRKFLRKLILEEAEKHGNEVKANVLFELDSENFGLENEGEMLLRRFEAEIENLIQNLQEECLRIWPCCSPLVSCHRRRFTPPD